MRHTVRYFGLIPAAGVGLRMGADSGPKQYLPLGRKSMLGHSIDAMLTDARVERMFVVVARSDERWRSLGVDAGRVEFLPVGGVSRAESVRNGLVAVAARFDDDDRVLYQQRLRNELTGILAAVAPFRETLQGIAVESTYNWYWLVDGLMDAGYVVHLAHVPALPQYSGLKHADDQSDARWLAYLLRLGLLPTGHIYRRPTGHSEICSVSAGSGCDRRPRTGASRRSMTCACATRSRC